MVSPGSPDAGARFQALQPISLSEINAPRTRTALLTGGYEAAKEADTLDFKQCKMQREHTAKHRDALEIDLRQDLEASPDTKRSRTAALSAEAGPRTNSLEVCRAHHSGRDTNRSSENDDAEATTTEVMPSLAEDIAEVLEREHGEDGDRAEKESEPTYQVSAVECLWREAPSGSILPLFRNRYQSIRSGFDPENQGRKEI
jgi:hypothetical protein